MGAVQMDVPFETLKNLRRTNKQNKKYVSKKIIKVYKTCDWIKEIAHACVNVNEGRKQRG
jgi:hypothetical protein